MVKFMERTSAAIGLIATALLVVSVSYDFAYLTGLSLSFAQVPTTLADHTRSAVLWIPIVGSALLPGSSQADPCRAPDRSRLRGSRRSRIVLSCRCC